VVVNEGIEEGEVGGRKVGREVGKEGIEHKESWKDGGERQEWLKVWRGCR